MRNIEQNNVNPDEENVVDETVSGLSTTQKIVIVIVVMIVIALSFMAVIKFSSRTKPDVQSTGSDFSNEIQTQVDKCMLQYVKTEKMGVLSDDEIADLTAGITTEVLNRVNNSTTGLTAAQQNEVRAILAGSVKETVDSYNKTRNTAITDEEKKALFTYANDEIIPELTKKIVNDKTIFNEKNSKLATITVSDTTKEKELQKLKVAMTALVKAETEGRISEDSLLSDRIAVMKNGLSDEMTSKINTIKEELTTQIQNNKTLTEVQRTELLDRINTITADNIASIDDIKIELKNYADTQDDALRNAITSLRISSTSDIETLKIELAKQIKENPNLSESQKNEIIQYITDISTGNVEDVKSELLAEMQKQNQSFDTSIEAMNKAVDEIERDMNQKLDNQNTAIMAMIDEIKTSHAKDVESLKSELIRKIEADKVLSDEQKTEITEYIKTISATDVDAAKTELTAKLDDMNNRFSELENRVVANETGVAQANTGVSENAKGINDVNIRFNELENKVTANEIGISGNTKSINDMNTTLDTKINKNANGIANLNDELSEIKKSVGNGKTTVAAAITNQGVPTANDADFGTMATNIMAIGTNKYNEGYNNGYTNGHSDGIVEADNRANTNSESYKSGYNAGIEAGKQLAPNESFSVFSGDAPRVRGLFFDVNSLGSVTVKCMGGNDDVYVYAMDYKGLSEFDGSLETESSTCHYLGRVSSYTGQLTGTYTKTDVGNHKYLAFKYSDDDSISFALNP